VCVCVRAREYGCVCVCVCVCVCMGLPLSLTLTHESRKQVEKHVLETAELLIEPPETPDTESVESESGSPLSNAHSLTLPNTHTPTHRLGMFSAHNHTYTPIHTPTHTHHTVYMYIYIYAHTHTHTHPYIHPHTHHNSIYVYIHTHTHTPIHTPTHTQHREVGGFSPTNVVASLFVGLGCLFTWINVVRYLEYSRPYYVSSRIYIYICVCVCVLNGGCMLHN